MELRDALLMIVTGQKKVGKTFNTLKMFVNYVKANPKIGKKAKKILIYDINMEYTDFKTIALKDVKRYTMQKRVEIRRVVPIMEDGKLADIDDKLNILFSLLESFADGLLVLEDINKYLISTTSIKKVISTITSNRHVDLDIIIHLQSLAALTPRFWQNTSVIRFHKQQDEIDSYKGRIPYYEILRIAEILVNNKYYAGNKRFFCYVSSEESYIRGDFTKEDITTACQQYALRHSKEVKYLQDSLDGKTSKKEAVKIITEQLIGKYYN